MQYSRLAQPEACFSIIVVDLKDSLALLNSLIVFLLVNFPLGQIVTACDLQFFPLLALHQLLVPASDLIDGCKVLCTCICIVLILE